jgi:hypothetical protein
LKILLIRPDTCFVTVPDPAIRIDRALPQKGTAFDHPIVTNVYPKADKILRKIKI